MVLPAPIRPLALALAGATLVAGCGGGGTPSGAPEYTGVLRDSPVQGVHYLRSGGGSGTTDALGQFRYREGETVEFRIGKLVLGSVTASGTAMTVTPLELAAALALADRPDRVTNLLILLQSLDSDGDPDGGITVPAAAIEALDEDAEVATLDLDAAPADFLADPDLEAIVAAINAADPDATAQRPASVAAALDHFRRSFLNALAGSYLGALGNNPVAFRFLDDGRYLLGEVDVSGSGSGLERGSIDWDPATGKVTVNVPDQDTNGNRGFSYIRALANVHFRVDGGDLVVTERNLAGTVTSSYRVARHYNDPAGLAGTWTKGSADSLQVLHFFLRSDGLAMTVNPGADRSLLGRTVAGCNQPGIEFGNYTQGTGFVAFSNILAYDTDGCGGVHDGSLPGYLGTNAHLSAVISSPNYAVSMVWSWTPPAAATQSATLYRPALGVTP